MFVILPLISSKKLINQTFSLILIKVFTFTQSHFSIIDENSFNHMQVSNFNQSNLSIKIKIILTHIIIMLCRFNIVLTSII